MTSNWRLFVAYGGLFFIVIALTISYSRITGGFALVWFGTAVSANWLLATARGNWLAVIAAIMGLSSLATAVFGFGPALALPLALANLVEALIAATLLRKARPSGDWLDSVQGLCALIAVCGIAAPVVSSLAGASFVVLLKGGDFWKLALDWSIAHALGTIIGFPMIRLLFAPAAKREEKPFRTGRVIEFTAHFALVLAISLATINEDRLALLFVPIVPVMLAAFRGGRIGAAGSVVIVGIVSVWTLGAHAIPPGSFASAVPERILLLQFYLATLTLLAIPTSVALREHRLVLRELEHRKALKRLIADHSDDALLNLDPAGCVRYASPAGLRMTGKDSLEGEHLSVFFDDFDAPLVRIALSSATARPNETQILERSAYRDGTHFWFEAKLRAVEVSDVHEGFAVTIRDVTARKEAEIAAMRAAETDQLTGLPNRRALLTRLEARLRKAQAQPFALAIIDLDHFKQINDTHGHLVGDVVLKAVGEVMSGMSRHGQLFARLGGEEFALLSFNPDPGEMLALCENLRARIASLTFDAETGGQFRLSASIGTAVIAHEMTTSEALQTADRLLYAAKHQGRDRVVTGWSTPQSRLRLIA